MSQPPNKSVVRRCELMQDVAENVATHMAKKYHANEDQAADVGNQVADFLADHWKGQTIYIPADTVYKQSARDAQICERMGRGNAHEIAAEFNLSYVRVYQIYRRWLLAKRVQRQSVTVDQFNFKKCAS